MARLATFWSGPLSALERACLTSFAAHGHTVTLYGYEAADTPAGVSFRNAGEILDARFRDRFITNGRPNVAHFADYFRLLMMRRTGETWIDADMFCREGARLDDGGDILVEEAPGLIINCVLRINDAALLDEAIRQTEALLDRDLPWAATQNILPGAMRATGYRGAVTPAACFSPVGADDWFLFLLPEFRERCEAACAGADAVHLYNNILQKVGYLKDALPPRGSYARQLIEAAGLTFLFVGEYPEAVVRALVLGWQRRYNGEDIGVGALVRQLVPSIRRSIAFRRFR